MADTSCAACESDAAPVKQADSNLPSEYESNSNTISSPQHDALPDFPFEPVLPRSALLTLLESKFFDPDDPAYFDLQTTCIAQELALCQRFHLDHSLLESAEEFKGIPTSHKQAFALFCRELSNLDASLALQLDFCRTRLQQCLDTFNVLEPGAAPPRQFFSTTDELRFRRDSLLPTEQLLCHTLRTVRRALLSGDILPSAADDDLVPSSFMLLHRSHSASPRRLRHHHAYHHHNHHHHHHHCHRHRHHHHYRSGIDDDDAPSPWDDGNDTASDHQATVEPHSATPRLRRPSRLLTISTPNDSPTTLSPVGSPRQQRRQLSLSNSPPTSPRMCRPPPSPSPSPRSPTWYSPTRPLLHSVDGFSTYLIDRASLGVRVGDVPPHSPRPGGGGMRMTAFGFPVPEPVILPPELAASVGLGKKRRKKKRCILEASKAAVSAQLEAAESPPAPAPNQQEDNNPGMGIGRDEGDGAEAAESTSSCAPEESPQVSAQSDPAPAQGAVGAAAAAVASAAIATFAAGGRGERAAMEPLEPPPGDERGGTGSP